MQNVSKKYKESMESQIRNRAYLRVWIGVVNVEAQKGLMFDEERNNLAFFSNEVNVLNSMPVNNIYATNEEDFSKVDGSMYFTPDINGEIYNNGIATQELMGSIYMKFKGDESFDIKGLTIDFGDNFPSEFMITYDGGVKNYSGLIDGLFKTEDAFTNTTYFIITPITMRNVNTRLRIYSLSCGFTNLFTNKEIISFSSKENVSLISDTIPSLDVSLEVDNQNQYYNPDDDESALAFLEEGQQLTYSFGYEIEDGEIEWVTPITTYLDGWKANDKVAKFTSTDIFNGMNDVYYNGKYVEDGISLGDLATDVLYSAGIEQEMYYIDPYLFNVIVNNPIPVVKHSEALQIIANAGRCSLYSGRNNKIYLKTAFIPNMYPSTNGETEYSDIGSILETSEKVAYAICSNDFTTIDGTSLFMSSQADLLPTCYYSSYISDDMGYFETTPKIIIDLETSFAVFGISIKFRNVAPLEFHIMTYLEGELVEDRLVQNPDMFYTDTEQFKLLDRIEIVFTKTIPNSRIAVDYVNTSDKITDYTISRSSSMTSSPDAERQKKIRSISVVRNIYNKSNDGIRELSNESVKLDSSLEVVVQMNNPSYNYSVVSDNDVEIVGSGAYHVKLKFSNVEPGAKVTYSVKGYEYYIDKQYYAMNHDNAGEVKQWDNPLISDLEHAKVIEEWLSEHFLGKVEYDISWRGDPRVDANDLFYIELKNGKKEMIRSYENILKFNGAFSSKMRARRVIR